MSAKDEEILEVWADFFVSHAFAVKEIEEALAGHAPLTLSEYDLLLAIVRHPDQRIRFSDLAVATVYTKSGVTRIFRRMEEAGFVLREECERDGRVSYATLTSEGREAMRKTWQHYRKGILSIFADTFSHAELKQLGVLLGKLAHRVQPPTLVQLRKK